MNPDPLTPAQRRDIQSRIAACGSCRTLLDIAKSLGHDDPDLRNRIDHLERGQRDALDLADMAKGLPK